MPPQRVVCAAVLCLVALSVPRAGADLIPWSYAWNAQPAVINAASRAPNLPPPGGITLTPGAISITGGTPGAETGSARMTAVNLSAFIFSPGPGGAADAFHDAPYSLGITLTDKASNASGTLTFSGVFDGTLTSTAVSLQTHFTTPSRQCLVLGRNRYTVSLTGFTPPGPPSLGGEGRISADVDVRPAGTPEPSGLVLAATALAAALACRGRVVGAKSA